MIAKGAIASALYSVVVLDELNPVLDLGLLDIDDVVRSLANRPEGMEIIVTGRAAPPSGSGGGSALGNARPSSSRP